MREKKEKGGKTRKTEGKESERRKREGKGL